MSKRQRPKVDDYADEGYLFGVLHFPVYDRAVQRLNAAEGADRIGERVKETAPVLFRIAGLAQLGVRKDGAKLGKEHHELGLRRREVVPGEVRRRRRGEESAMASP